MKFRTAEEERQAREDEHLQLWLHGFKDTPQPLEGEEDWT